MAIDGDVERVSGGDSCQLTWSPDDAFVYLVDSGGHMGTRILRFVPGADRRTRWLDMPGPYSHEYFPRLSQDGNYLVLGASAGGHEHDVADYEIFLWQVDTPNEDAVRLTFHTGNDSWPDIHIRSR